MIKLGVPSRTGVPVFVGAVLEFTLQFPHHGTEPTQKLLRRSSLQTAPKEQHPLWLLEVVFLFGEKNNTYC